MWQILLAVAIVCFVVVGMAMGAENQGPPGKPAVNLSKTIQVHPIGVVKRQGDQAIIELRPELAPALDGLTGFSHVWVLYWFHGNDRPEERATLQVHPRRDPTNPLTGVFATRAPVRPNLIGFSACRIIGVHRNVLEVEGLDALEGSPVLDLKPYIPESDALPEAKTPQWLTKRKNKNAN
jgi:tRNA (adenine37-N6)-methyltransferase